MELRAFLVWTFVGQGYEAFLPPDVANYDASALWKPAQAVLGTNTVDIGLPLKHCISTPPNSTFSVCTHTNTHTPTPTHPALSRAEDWNELFCDPKRLYSTMVCQDITASGCRVEFS